MSNQTGFRQGRLGIGKNPIFPLDISGSTRIEGDLILGGTIADINGTPIEFGGSSATLNVGTNMPIPEMTVSQVPSWSNNVTVEGAGKFEDSATAGDIYYNGGNVGIGTTSPVDTRAILHLPPAGNSGISFQATTTETDSRNWRIRHDDYGPLGTLQFTCGDSNTDIGNSEQDVVMCMTKDRKVGIGTARPRTLLNVNGNSSSATDIFYPLFLNNNTMHTGSNVGGGVGIKFHMYDNGNVGDHRYSTIAGVSEAQSSAKTALAFYTNDDVTSAPNERMRIDNAGNIGIGTTSPNYKLEVEMSGGNGGLRVKNTTNSAEAVIWTEPDYASYLYFGANNANKWSISSRASGEGYDLKFYRFNPGALEVMTMDYATGNVGIGTTSPGEKLEVNGKVQIGNVVLGQHYTADYFGIIHKDLIGDNDNYAFLCEKTGHTYMNCKLGKEIHLREDNDEIMTLTGGNVGIGTTTPGEKLEVNGKAKISSNVAIGHTNSPITRLDIRENGGPRLRLENTSGGYSAQNGAIEFCTTYATTGFIHQKGEQLRIGTTGSIGEIRFYTYNNTGYPDQNGNTQTQSFFNETYTTGNDDPRMVIDETGNVGIGTTSPYAKLHINDGYLLISENTDSRENCGGVIGFYTTDMGVNGLGTTPIQAYIGTRTHSYDESLANQRGKDRGEMVFYIGNNDNDGWGPDRFNFIGAEYRFHAKAVYPSGGVSQDGKQGLDNICGQVSDSDCALFIDTDKHIGIGTTSPNEKLNINDSSTSATGIIYPLKINNQAMHAQSNVGGGVGIKFHMYDNGNTEYRYSAIVGISEATFSNKTALAFYTNNNSTTAPLERMRIDNEGNVGIGTTSPGFPLEIDGGTGGTTVGAVGYLYYGSDGSNTSSNSYNDTVSFKVSNSIWAGQYVFANSDERIKTNIVDVEDNLALEMVRNIPCRYYEYKNKLERGVNKTIGFIAQDVKEVLPMAVSLQKNIIPNEMRKLTDINWNDTTLSTDLSDCSGIKYRFYVSNDPSGNDEEMKEVIGNADNTFTFDTRYNNVFCYGKEVDDFHTLDKQKLFALNFSATQELDRQQQADKDRIVQLETTVQLLMERITALENNATN